MKTKRILAAVLSAALFLIAFTGCAQKQDNTFKVGFDPEYPPYTYKADDGSYTGFDIELAKALCEKKGWTFEAVPIDWTAKDFELESGAIDCIWSGFTINGREDDYAWTKAYVDNSQVILTKKDSGIDTIAALAGKKVGVQAGSSALELLKDDLKSVADTFGSLVEFADYNTAFVELQAGSIDAVAMDIGVAKYQVASRGDGYKICSEILASEKYGIGFRKSDTSLRDEVEAALMELVADGTYKTLAEKYELTDYIILQ